MERMRHFKLRSLVALFLCIIGSLLLGCARDSKRVVSPAKRAVGETFFAVAVAPALKGPIQDFLETNGEVVSKVCVDVFPDNNGKITRFLKELGDSVKIGEVIGYVDPSRPGQTFSLSPIRAPISGTITSLPYRAGATVNVQTSVAKISRLDQLEIITYVAERFFSRIQVGQKALIKFDAYPGLVFEGKISQIAPFISSAKRTLELKIALLDNAQKPPVEMGMFAEIRLIVEDKKQVIKIPSTAVTYRNGLAYVFVVKDKQTQEKNTLEALQAKTPQEGSSVGDDSKAWVEQRKIQEGISMDGQIEVLSGIKEGEWLVVRGQNSLGDGSGVRIVEVFQTQKAK